MESSGTVTYSKRPGQEPSPPHTAEHNGERGTGQLGQRIGRDGTACGASHPVVQSRDDLSQPERHIEKDGRQTPMAIMKRKGPFLFFRAMRVLGLASLLAATSLVAAGEPGEGQEERMGVGTGGRFLRGRGGGGVVGVDLHPGY